MALGDTSSDGIRYLGGGYIAISEAVEEVLILRQEVQNFIELSMGILHFRRRPGSGHDLVRDACNTVMCSVARNTEI